MRTSTDSPNTQSNPTNLPKVYSTKTKVEETKSTYYSTKTETYPYSTVTTKLTTTSSACPYTTTLYAPTASPPRNSSVHALTGTDQDILHDLPHE